MSDDLALFCERVLTGRLVDGDAERWQRLQLQQAEVADELQRTARMHRLLSVAFAAPSGAVVAQHAIHLARCSGEGERQRAVGATVLRIHGRRRRHLLAAALAATVLVGVSLWLILAQPAVAEPQVSAGDGFVIEAAPADGRVRDADGRALTTARVPVGGSLRGAGPWQLRSADGRVLLRVSGDSHLAVPESTVLRIERGEVHAEVQSGSPSPWRFSSPHADVRIRGTAFSLRVAERDTSLSVTAGVVEFQPVHQPAFPVRAGVTTHAEGADRVIWAPSDPRQLMPDWDYGSRGCVPAPDERQAFRGEAAPPAWGPPGSVVCFATADGEGLAAVPSGSRVAADLWIDPQMRGAVTVQGWELDARQNFQVFLTDLPRGRWVSVLVSVDDLKPVEPAPSVGPWRRPRTLLFMVGGSQSHGLWVARPRLLAP